MKHELSKLGVTITISQGCACRGSPTTYIYTLPIRITADIEEALKPLGNSSMSFVKHSMVKINNSNFSLIAVNRLKQIKFTIKKPIANRIKEQLEDLLIEYIKKRKVSG